MPPQAPWGPERVQATASAYWQSCALHAAVSTGLAAALAQSPAGLEELRQRLVLDRRGLAILLRALVGLELVEELGGLYSLNPDAAPFLTPGQPKDMTNLVLHMSDMVPDWAQLADCVRTGRPVDRPEHEAPGPNPGREHFYRAMRDNARQMARGLAARLGLQAGQGLLDMGGGPGVYALTFVEETPGLSATVFDLPGAEPYFHEEEEAHPGAVARFLAGDYLRDQVGGGPYDWAWLSQVLHGQGPGECAVMLAKAAEALRPGGRLVVQEFVVEKPGHPFSGLFGLNMLVNTPQGWAYTHEELTGMLAAAGLVEVVGLGATREGGPASLLAGRKPA